MTFTFTAKYPGQCATCDNPIRPFSTWDDKATQIEAHARVVKDDDGQLHHLNCYAVANPITNETTYKANRKAAGQVCWGWDRMGCTRDANGHGGRIRLGTKVRYNPIGQAVHAECAPTAAEREHRAAQVAVEVAKEAVAKVVIAANDKFREDVDNGVDVEVAAAELRNAGQAEQAAYEAAVAREAEAREAKYAAMA